MNEKTFAEIIEETKGVVLTAIGKFLHHDLVYAIDDVAQETYLRAYKGLASGKFKGDSKISTWLYTIARNESFRMNDKHARLVKFQMKSGAIDTDEPYETYDDEIEDIERMKDSIDVMPKKYRDVFVQTIQGANEKV